jgi:two-component system NarL family response regulator
MLLAPGIRFAFGLWRAGVPALQLHLCFDTGFSLANGPLALIGASPTPTALRLTVIIRLPIIATHLALVRGPMEPEHQETSVKVKTGNFPGNSSSVLSALSPSDKEKEVIAGRVSVLVADEHPIVLQGLTALLGQQPDIHVVKQARSGEEAVQYFAEFSPDIGLFDFQLAGISGIQAMQAILQVQPKAKIIIFTACQGEEHIYRSIEAGARGYLLKTSSAEEIIASIHTVHQGQTWIPPAIGATLARRLAAPELTKREREVLNVLSAGKSNKQIGIMLNMSEGTVKVHITHILEKLKVDGRTEALNVAFARGLIAPGISN